MNSNDFDIWLDRTTRDLPRAIEPANDLWPGIAQRLHDTSTTDAGTSSRLWPFVAGIAATLLITLLMSPLREGQLTAPVSTTTAFEPGQDPVIVLEPTAAWVPEIRRTRNELDPGFRSGLESLPPETREMVEANLRQIHESLAQIHAALAEDPGNLTLHRLLAGTYQQEIELISTIGTMTPSEQGL